ncbi:MAG: hypothetical protein UT30_C0005G0047 [Candidatus Uhrbacteria bacterium GW2011_GWF2_39_13]|uniref:Uncharacterized protein n=1 Tax=Candidatus Uhrbacteria bacterium GW2011_GWF2_39_13 TaxID=1618995 RepID=A0A0G0MKY1_9BACT|nr:MAG: hypothetical protein UT30_C0005G0047 [Candidatus Uhrbacteria bacterium GW2011_GWF2_39_13]HAU66431.1 hypothetical protein [Candidatus Uhrbacteria bacterium]
MNEQNIPQINEPVQSSKNIWITIIAVVLTAIIVGGVVHAWQKIRLQSIEQSLQQQINTLQSQIESLQQTTPPVATTPETTQVPTQSTGETASWQTYENKELEFSFRYPASYGNFQISINNGETGKKFTGNFQNNNHFSIGGITADYSSGRSAYFLDFVKYLNEGGKYYHLMALDKKWLVEPTKILTADGQKILIVNGDSYVEERNVQGPTINPGSNGGALINMSGSGEFKGIAVWNDDVNDLPQSDFEEILMTFKFTK